jgi:hypothetical protein
MRLLPGLAALLFALPAMGCGKPEALVRLPIPHDPAPQAAVAPASEAPAPEEAAPADAPIDPEAFAHVIVEGARTFVVLHADPDDASWAVGAPELVSDANPIVTRRAVEIAAIPPSHARRAGMPVRLFDAEGVVCEGKLGAISILSRVEPHFGVRQDWQGGEDIDGVITPPATTAQIAEQAWDMSQGGRALVAEVQGARGDCANALFARSSELSAPRPIKARTASPVLVARAIKELRALPAYAEIAAQYKGSGAHAPGTPWENHEGASPTVHVFSGDDETYVFIDVSAGTACSDFEGKLSALWKIEGETNNDAHFAKIYEGSDDFAPAALVQLDPGDAPLWVGTQSILRRGPHGYAVHALVVPFLDCPC